MKEVLDERGGAGLGTGGLQRGGRQARLRRDHLDGGALHRFRATRVMISLNPERYYLSRLGRFWIPLDARLP